MSDNERTSRDGRGNESVTLARAIEAREEAREAAAEAKAAAASMNDCFDRFEKILFGGDDPSKGLITRFEVSQEKADARERAYEKAEENRRWWLRTTAGAAIAALFVSLRTWANAKP